MTPVERLSALLEKASARPWKAKDLLDPALSCWGGASRGAQEDAELTAAAVNALPDLLALARAAKALDDGPPIGGRLAADLHDALEPLYPGQHARVTGYREEGQDG